MACIQHKIIAEIDPAAPPVLEIRTVILAILPYYKGQEIEVLRGVIEYAAGRIKQMHSEAENAEATNG